jgi:ABC-type transport system involved in multi-copper enzyme maturation permease subunit
MNPITHIASRSRAAALLIRHLSGLSPFGPIFGKELRTTARRKRSYVLRVAYLGGLLLAMLAAWAETSARGVYAGIAAQTQAQAELGRSFFASFCMFSIIAMAAIGPVLTSTAVSAERLGKTLHVLLMTPITAWQIVAGKLFSRLLVALTLLGLSLPALALVRLLGGVELWQMAGILCVCAATALASAAIGLLFSTFMNRAYAVILMSYATLLFLYAFLPFAAIAGLGVRFMPWVRVFGACNPFACAGTLAEPQMSRMFGAVWESCVLVHLGFTAVLLTASAAVLRRVARKAGGQSSTESSDSSAPPLSTQPMAPGTAPGISDTTGDVGSLAGRAAPRHHRRPVARGRDVSDFPVVWREVRRPLMARRWQSVAAAFVTIGLLIVTYALVAWNDGLASRDTHRVYAVIFNGLLWLLTAVLSATAIAQEKESDTWTLLLTTPLGGRAIVWGKVLGLYRRIAWPFALFAAHLLIFGVADVIDLSGALLAIWVLFSFNTLWVATGLYLSLRLHKVTVAVIINLLLAVILYLGVGAVLVIVAGLWGFRELPEQVGWYTPYYYLVVGISENWPFWRNGVLRMPGDVRVGYTEFALIVTFVGAAHIIVATAILSATASAFDRVVGRAGGPVSRGGSPRVWRATPPAPVAAA